MFEEIEKFEDVLREGSTLDVEYVTYSKLVKTCFLHQ